MDFNQFTEQIQRKLYENGINIKTQDYILEYIYINQKLFGNFLDIDTLVNRITNNLKSNITSMDKKGYHIQEIKRIFGAKGRWSPKENTIIINPIIKLKSIVSKGSKMRQNSTIRHELDHCATTKFVQLSEQEIEEYAEYFIKNKKIEDSKGQLMAKRYIKNVLGDGQIPIVGIRDSRYEIQNNIDLKLLNEGITVYKQEMYDKYLGYKTRSNYRIEKNVAKFIADIIGEKELIQYHFNNDYESIRTAFKNRTGKDLNPLIQELNKEPNFIARLFLGKIYTSKFNKVKNEGIHKFIEETSINNKQHKRNVDFVPKYNIDYEIVKNNLQSEKQLGQIPKNNKIEMEER